MKMRFLTNAMIPGAMMMPMWGLDEKPFRTLQLNSSYCSNHNVSGLKLHVTGISVISYEDDECKLAEIKWGQQVEAVGPVDHIIFRSSRVLKTGTYKALRFYVTGEKSEYYYSDNTRRHLVSEDFLDFEFTELLQIVSDENPKFRLEFSLCEFERQKHFIPSLRLFFRLSWLR